MDDSAKVGEGDELSSTAACGDGKYVFNVSRDGKLSILRYGKPWWNDTDHKTVVPTKAIIALVGQVEKFEIQVTKLFEVCAKVQSHADQIPVRVNLDGKGMESIFLTEMPSTLAIWWAMHFVLRVLMQKDPPIDGEATDNDD